MIAGRALRGLSGVLTGGLAILLMVLVGSWVASALAGTPGPGAELLVGHLVAAGLAAWLQRVADQRSDTAGLVASCAVLLVAVVVALVFWMR
jgi:hypothetical protein